MQRLTQILSRPLVWMIVVIFAAFWQVAFCRYAMQWDMTDQIFIWHRYINECFHAHSIPFWAPYSRFGYPISSDPQSGLFYPVTWLFTGFLRYTLYSNNLEYIIHIILAAVGMKYLLETLKVSRFASAVFGLVYAMSGPFISNATHLILIDSLCWLPFILGSYIRFLRSDKLLYLLLTALFFFLNLCGGYAGITMILIYVLFGLLAYHLITFIPRAKADFVRISLRHVLLVFVTILLAGGYLYAVAKGVPYIDRSESISKEQANSVSFRPLSLITIISPSALGSTTVNFDTNITMQDMYLGVIPLFLGIVFVVMRGRRSAYIIAAGSFFFLLAAMGPYTPIRGWMYDYMPLMKLFRHAGIIRFFSCIGFMILAARGFDELFKPEGPLYKWMLAFGLLLTGAIYVVLAIKFPGYFSFKDHAAQVQLVLIFLSVIFLLMDRFSLHLKKNLIGVFIIADMIIAVQSGMTRTIICNRSVSEIQSRIDKYPSVFLESKNTSLLVCNQWNDSTIAPPIWQNAGFLKKQVSFEGYGGYVLKNYLYVCDSPNSYKTIKDKKLIEASEGGEISITEFSPNHFCFDVRGQKSEMVTLGQMNFPGWSALVDQRGVPVSESSDHFVSCAVPAGHHHVEMSFCPIDIKGAFVYTIAIVILVLMAIGFLSKRQIN